jgi:hypothetical protein
MEGGYYVFNNVIITAVLPNKELASNRQNASLETASLSTGQYTASWKSERVSVTVVEAFRETKIIEIL